MRYTLVPSISAAARQPCPPGLVSTVNPAPNRLRVDTVPVLAYTIGSVGLTGDGEPRVRR